MPRAKAVIVPAGGNWDQAAAESAVAPGDYEGRYRTTPLVRAKPTVQNGRPSPVLKTRNRLPSTTCGQSLNKFAVMGARSRVRIRVGP